MGDGEGGGGKKGAGDGENTSIEMRVEVNHCHGAVGSVDRPEERKGDSVVAAEGDHAGEGLALERGAFLAGVGLGGPRKDGIVTFFDLVERPCVVVSRCI